MDIYEFIRTQGEYADKHAGVGQRNIELAYAIDELLEDIGDLNDILVDTVSPEVPKALRDYWIAVAFLAFDAARRMGATQTDFEHGMKMMLQGVKEAAKTKGNI